MVVPLVIGALFTGMGIYEAIASAFDGVLISHARGFWRWLIVVIFAIFVAHAVVEWAHDDAAERAAREWRF